MDGMINLFRTVVQSPWRNKYLDSLLSSCTEHQAFIASESSELQAVVAHINSELNNRRRRYEGLLILKTFLSQCPDEIFTSNAFSWASQSLKTFEAKTDINEDPTRVENISFLVLRDLVETSAQFPDVSKQMLSLMSKLLQVLTVNKKKVKYSSLGCLQSCMNYYSGQCMSYKGAIEKLLLALLYSEDEVLVLEASNCFRLLPLLYGSGGKMGTILINAGNRNCCAAFNQLLLKVVGSLHLLLNKLFEGVNEVEKTPDTIEVLAVPFEDEESLVLIKQSLLRKYTNLCQYLCSMLINPLPAAKTIPIEEVMRLICRALAITCTSLKDSVSSEILALSAGLPQIHSATFSILRAMVACSKLGLLPYGSLIVKLVMQSLKWTGSSKDWPSAVRKPYSSVRCSAYTCLTLWLSISASASCAEEVAGELIDMAFVDIVPTREKLKLMSSDSINRPHGKHRKRKKLEVAEATSANKSVTSNPFASDLKCALGDGSANADICCAALEMLAALLHSVGPFLKPIQHKIIQDTTISLLIDIQRSSHATLNYKQTGGKERLAGVIVPYQCDAQCRLSLLKVLLALVLEPHSHKWPPPIGLAAHIFGSGQTDSNVEVVAFCMQATRIVERLLHPCATTLNFPVSLSDMLGVKQSSSNIQSSQTEAMETVEVSVQKNLVEFNGIANKEDHVPKKKARGLPEDESSKGEYPVQQGSSASDVIVLSDSEQSPSLKLFTYTSNEESQNSRSSIVLSPNELMLVRRVEKLDGNQSVVKAMLDGMPITTLESRGVQANGETLNNTEESPVTASGSESPHPPVLVLKLPIQGCGSSPTKDFSQQFTKGDSNDSAKPMEVSIVKECHDRKVKISEKNSCSEINLNLATPSSKGDNDECKEVLVVEQKMLDIDSCNHINHHSGEESDDARLKSVAKDDKGVDAPAEVEIVELDKNTEEDDVPLTKQMKVVELDVDNLSEGEEMVSCFVDVSSESE